MASNDRKHIRGTGISNQKINGPIDWDIYLTIAIKDLNDAGIRYADLSDDIKEQATSFEHKISLYAMHDDLSAFILAVHEWRNLMIENFRGKE